MSGSKEIAGVFFLLIVLGLLSCEESESTIGFSGLDNKIQTVMVDTFTIKTSTVLLDSIHTSGTGRILLGSYHDPVLGQISSSSYFLIAPSVSSWTISTDAIYDSIAVLLTPDGYYTGDTTVTQQITVEQLNQNLIGRSVDRNIFKDIPYSYFYSDGGMYNTSRVGTYDQPLATFNYRPAPHNKDSIVIRLDDNLGREWFKLARNNNAEITSTGNFLTMFKGLKISSAKTNASLTGFSSAKAKVRVYYHVATNSEYPVNSTFDVPIYQSTLQYNQFETDFSSTPLSALGRSRPLSSELTNNETFVQGGSGVITKIEFPHLDLLNELNENITILQAILVVTAVQEYPQVYELPAELALYYTNDLNIPTTVVPDESNATKPNVTELSTNKEFNQYSRYAFLINTYVSALIKGNKSYPKELFVGLNLTDLPGTVNRVRLGGANNPNYEIKLQIYYSRYQNSQ